MKLPVLEIVDCDGVMVVRSVSGCWAGHRDSLDILDMDQESPSKDVNNKKPSIIDFKEVSTAEKVYIPL